MNNPKPGDLRVWWIPQLGMRGNPFYWYVKSPEEGKLLMDALAQYDLYQLHNRIKPDYANVGGLEIYDADTDGDGTSGWMDWMSGDGFDIDQYFENLKEEDEEPRLLVPMTMSQISHVQEWLTEQLTSSIDTDYADNLKQLFASYNSVLELTKREEERNKK